MAPSFARLILLLVTLTWTVSASPIVRERGLLFPDPILPSQDPFYQPPEGFENEAPGAILAHREIDIPLPITLLSAGIAKAAYQILYRSTDSQGEPNAVVTTLFVPVQADAEKFLTHSIAYDSADVDCSPSYSLRTANDTQPDLLVIALALYSGWYVQSPDYESYTAGFTDGVLSGQTLLDSLRACLKSREFTGLCSEARIALNGGSGGALATEWALELQPTYAPELKIAGAALGSLTPSVREVYDTINGGLFAGLAPNAIVGLANAIPEFNTYLDDALLPERKADFYKARTQCLDKSQSQFAFQNISLYFKNPNFMQDEETMKVVNSVGVMGVHGTPGVPLYIYKGVEDEISPVGDMDALVNKFCAEGVPSVTYLRNVVSGHLSESLLGIIGAYEYITERLNGVAATPGCTIINGTKSTFSDADATALGGLGPVIIEILSHTLATVPINMQ